MAKLDYEKAKQRDRARQKENLSVVPINLKHKSKCVICNKWIAKGKRANWYPDYGRVTHIEC